MTQKLNLPRERMIVLAGVTPEKNRIAALQERRVKAVMCSFYQLNAKALARVSAALRTWPTLKLLDSGVFTFLRKTGKLRRQATEKKVKTVGVGSVITLEEFQQYAEKYMAYLREHLDDWDFVVELDVDNIFGVEVSRAFRTKLQRIAGDKLLPVWHSISGASGWADCYNEFPYIGTGSDKPMDLTAYRRLVNEAHAHGAVVHGFGGTRPDVMQAVPYDTADSTTWLASIRFGQFAGAMFSRNPKTMSGRQMSRARDLERTIEAIGGATRESLVSRSPTKEQYLLAIALFQEREAALPPIPPPRVQQRLIEL